MSSLEERPADKLADMVFNVLWQDNLELWSALRKKLDLEGAEVLGSAFDGARTRFRDGPLEDKMEIRWGLDVCMLCNDDNIEKNGIAYVQPSGDGLEFNQCLNCGIGILYNLEVAKATMDSYVVGVGKPLQFAEISFFWAAIPSKDMADFQPVYEVVDNNGQWVGSVSFSGQLEASFLPIGSMTAETSRGAEEPWTTELPDNMKAGIEAFLQEAKEQIEVVLALR
ncbi:MAG: hypothetical protein JSW61_12550 [Candidatus Thorarchaeota archaeon]|nr:MAG: hypothetical protein JSW61_12550 [Candidatus Thorarchaeota archaeon]